MRGIAEHSGVSIGIFQQKNTRVPKSDDGKEFCNSKKNIKKGQSRKASAQKEWLSIPNDPGCAGPSCTTPQRFSPVPYRFLRSGRVPARR